MAPLRSAARFQPKLPSPGLPTLKPYPPLSPPRLHKALGKAVSTETSLDSLKLFLAPLRSAARFQPKLLSPGHPTIYRTLHFITLTLHKALGKAVSAENPIRLALTMLHLGLNCHFFVHLSPYDNENRELKFWLN